MSMTKSIITYGFLPNRLQVNPSRFNSQTRSIFLTSSTFATVMRYPGLSWDNAGRDRENGRSTRRFRVCNVVEPGASPPPESAFNFFQWIGIVATMIVPFFTKKWASLLKIKNDVDGALEIAEDIVEAVERVAEEVEKVAENIADDLPEGGTLRRAVDFVENLAERASHDAHMVDNFIDSVQEVEEKVEEYFESWGTGASMDHPSKEDKEALDESHTLSNEIIQHK